ncbi:ATP-dependent Lhr-like helicase [Barrientosiimonas humi]|uniref:ATP-dependent Lhr-like helicase n=1 Tax=Barrientosiimonas humi TaxID=999931 RepID=A0A542XA39_9MICO|nr:ATP-dependent helicase [Barrientosiimonas humi]TQL32705.1 ATP-dependent Lhr-like helicase [Barrientosiimonas humi]CAG7572696.1 ATP-dependent RNA helicase SrmB [Barrientosiimonas humi]
MASVLDRFSPATRAWFEGSFAEPTAAQAGAWEAISDGQHTLVVAPTGSGKTLSAFLWALDRVASEGPPDDPAARCRVLYVSPMKALAVDVERNLRAPLVGIRHAASRLELPEPDVTVAVRSGDTPAQERRAFQRTPTDVLITTPESLFLLLTSSAREALRGVETVIVDEVHAVAGTKRGAHLALSLERLDELLEKPAQRIGLSATVRPVEEVARFLAGGSPVSVVQPPSTKEWDLDVVVPVPDLGELGGASPADDADPQERASIWPHVEERIVDLVAGHRSTLVFANSRRLAERLTSRLNEIWAERAEAAVAEHADADADDIDDAPEDAPPAVPPRPPAQLMGQAGQAAGAPGVLARAHHGSVSKEQRAEIEDDLKAGRLPAVVATSSLELGIDMGAVDLVVQVESPPSVASGLQRVGRAGHQVGAVSRGVLFPKFRGDLVQTAVVVERMRAGAIEELRVPSNPVDVLAQQVVAMCALDDWTVDELERLVRRAAPYTSLPRSVLESVLDMLSGRYPSDEFAELRPRIEWDRIEGVLRGRRGAQRLAVTSGGTIPDRGLFGVFLATGEGPGRRVGELDEEMVYESRVGDVFTLGTSSWRIEDITHDQVLVTPAPGQPGRLPFWRGDSPGRPAELGRAVGSFVRELGGLDDAEARDRVRRAGLDEWATDNLLAYLGEQREATGHLPHDRSIVIERFRDELGDWRVVIHSPFGSPVHAPWALGLAARLRERFGTEVQALHGDDGIVLRLLDFEVDQGVELDRELSALLLLDPDDVERVVTDEIGGSALFASRFRECAARALLLPRRNPGRRQALWMQRQRSSQLLQVASRYPSFPIVLEAVRECVQDVFDVPGLVDLMRDVQARRIRVVEVETKTPSPFAKSLLFGYVAQFLYEGDSPLAERRAAALALDPVLLGELLGRDEGTALRDLLDPEVVAATEAELQRTTEERLARDRDDVADLLRWLGPLTTEAVTERTRPDVRDQMPAWLESLVSDRQVIAVRVAGRDGFALVDDAARLRDALGVSLPMGVPAVFLEPVDDPLGDLLARYARTHGPFDEPAVAAELGLGRAVVHAGLQRLVGAGRLVAGELRPLSLGGGRESVEYADAEVLRVLKRRSLASLRAEVEPVPARDLARFLPAWQGVGSGQRGLDGLLRAVEQLAGVALPASGLESLVLPARVASYRPSMLDELMAGGEVLWQGRGALSGDDGWVSLHLADSAHLTLTPPDAELELGPLHERVLQALEGGGAFFFSTLSERVAALSAGEVVGDDRLTEALWDLVWGGLVTGDTLAPLRALVGGGRPAHRARRTGPARSRYGRARTSLGGVPVGRRGVTGAGTSRVATPGKVGGRWSLLPPAADSPTERALATAEVLLDRYGIVTRGSVMAEGVPDGFAGVYRVLSTAEESGRVRRGYFVEGLGAAQFGTAGAVDRLRAVGRPTAPATDSLWEQPQPEPSTAQVLAAADPANPYGAALPWPDRPTSPDGASTDGATSGAAATGGTAAGAATTGHRPGRKSGSLVVLVDGALVLYVERGGKTLLSWSDDEATLRAAADALALAVREGALGQLTVTTADGDKLLGSEHPVAAALEASGFHATPRGLRLRG